MTTLPLANRKVQTKRTQCELNDGEAPDDHIFRHLETLDGYMAREFTADAPTEQTSDVSPFI